MAACGRTNAVHYYDKRLAERRVAPGRPRMHGGARRGVAPLGRTLQTFAFIQLPTTVHSFAFCSLLGKPSPQNLVCTAT